MSEDSKKADLSVASGRSSVFALNAHFKHDNLTKVTTFLKEASAAMGKKDFSRPLKVFESHWVDTVGDLRLLIQEGQLRLIGLPMRLCVWIEEEMGKTTSSANFLDNFSEVKAAPQGFVHQFDFDTNGVLYWIATEGGKKEWTNPATSGAVKVSTSGILHDSVPEHFLVGRETVRLVTKSDPHAWFAVDLLKHYLIPTKYTLRHYSSWDTECLRSWNFEASNDGQKWVVLKEHVNDESLNAQGATFTWDLENVPSIPFRMFRLKLTGYNSNKHFYLACSGMELYGRIADAPPVAALSPHNVEVFVHQEPFDVNGIIYALGTKMGKQQFENPATAGIIHVEASSMKADSVPIEAVVGREAVRCMTGPNPQNSTITIDFSNRRVCPTHYSLRHWSATDGDALRTWELQASADGGDYETLMAHVDDDSLSKKGAAHTWEIPPRYHSRPFRFFRLFLKGTNSSKHWGIACSGIEFYGQLIGVEASGAASPRSIAASPAMRLKGAKVFSYTSDLDGKGIIDYIGTNGGSTPWRNPAESKAISVKASSLMGDSVPSSAVVGHDVVRCVTKPHPNSWFIVDLLDKWVQPTHYMLRHYSSWDVEALRNWNFEGSNDGNNWTLLRKHTDDAHLKTIGGTHTWKLDTDQFYRMFRVLQWGVNSNKHNYLALSGFELYGTLSPEPPAGLERASVAAAGAAGNNTFVWDPATCSKFLQIDKNGMMITNTGSNDKWQMARTVMSASEGTKRFSLRILTDMPTSNTWKFIVGVVPTSFVKGKEWVGATNSWGYIGGTGGKCHAVARTVPYGLPFGAGDIVSVDLDFNASTITFLKNGISQGVAFSNLTPDVQFAVSFTGTGTKILLMDSDVASIPPSLTPTWDRNQKSKFLQVDEKTGVVTNLGSSDKWQSVRGIKQYESGTASFTVEVISCPKTPNNWQFIVGVVPQHFPLTWVGAAKSWGYIGGTGGKCYNVGASTPYADEWGEKGDKIRVEMNFDKKTLEFFKNEKSQGIAFTNLTGPVWAAASLTATGAQLRLLE